MHKIDDADLMLGAYYRLPHEPRAAFDAYVVFRDTGSLETVVTTLGVAPRRVREWRERYRWDDRVEHYMRENRRRGQLVASRILAAGALASMEYLYRAVRDENYPPAERRKSAELMLRMAGYLDGSFHASDERESGESSGEPLVDAVREIHQLVQAHLRAGGDSG